MLKNRIVSLLMFALFCVIFWNVLDFIYTSVFKHGGYSFSFFNDVCLPAVIGMTVFSITMLRQGKSGK